jgi:hypothetical protein
MNKKNEKIIASVLTVVILSLILFAGPAKAFVLELDTDKTSLTKGNDISFNVTFEIQNTDQYLPIQALQLELVGPTSSVCEFDVDANIISGCEGMTITPISTVNKGYGYGHGYDSATGYGYDFGYGYGYGYGYEVEMFLEYTITLNTANYNVGNYESILTASIGDETFESTDKPTFTINSPITVTGSGGGSGDGDGNQKDYSGSNARNFTQFSSNSCVENWTCSEWSNLEDACGTRTCIDVNSCDTEELKPVMVAECEQTGVLSAITGFATGVTDFVRSGKGARIILFYWFLLGLVVIFQKIKSFFLKAKNYFL